MTVVVVGAGFTGATVAERVATVLDEEVVVVERRKRVGGSAEDYRTEDGLLVQKCGPHVFHTNSTRVWDYLGSFGVTWLTLKYGVAALVGSELVPLPLGFRAAEIFAGPKAPALVKALTERYGLGARVGVWDLVQEFPGFGEWAIEHVFRGYNEKHWGMPLAAVPESVLRRLPIVIGNQDSYFTDKFQGVPAEGYTCLIERMLDRPRVRLALGTDYRDVEKEHPGATVVYTGSPDAYFGEDGALPYRTVTFVHGDEGMLWHSPKGGLPEQTEFATVTMPSSKTVRTRRTEHRLITTPGSANRLCVSDIPAAHEPGVTEPYYPIPLEKNIRLAQRYHERAPKHVFFAGRLGSYQYLNMDQAIAQGLMVFEKIRSARAA